MKKIIKKIGISLGSIAAIGSPIVAISCGEDKKSYLVEPVDFYKSHVSTVQMGEKATYSFEKDTTAHVLEIKVAPGSQNETNLNKVKETFVNAYEMLDLYKSEAKSFENIMSDWAHDLKEKSITASSIATQEELKKVFDDAQSLVIKKIMDSSTKLKDKLKTIPSSVAIRVGEAITEAKLDALKGLPLIIDYSSEVFTKVFDALGSYIDTIIQAAESGETQEDIFREIIAGFPAQLVGIANIDDAIYALSREIVHTSQARLDEYYSQAGAFQGLGTNLSNLIHENFENKVQYVQTDIQLIANTL